MNKLLFLNFYLFIFLLFFLIFFAQIISPTTLFLAAKVEEQPRKLEHVIKVAHACLNPQEPPLDTKSNVSLGISVYCKFESFFPCCHGFTYGLTYSAALLLGFLFFLPWLAVGVYQTPTHTKTRFITRPSLCLAILNHLLGV